MPKVVITGWIKGCDTVAAIKELREKVPMTLNDALAAMNRVLNNERVEVLVLSANNAQRIISSLTSFGLVATCIESPRVATGTQASGK